MGNTGRGNNVSEEPAASIFKIMFVTWLLDVKMDYGARIFRFCSDFI
jgi:hypothetical protein